MDAYWIDQTEVKGCSWYTKPASCRGVLRPDVDPKIHFDFLGFRCAKSEEGEADISSKPLVLPQGHSPALDGTMLSSKWDEAIVEKFADNSELFLMKDDEFLYLGIRAKESGTIAANIFIQREDEIMIMHSSLALGTAVYQHGEDS